MFNVVEKNQKLVKGLMIFIALTFVMWGIGSYLGMLGDDGYVAKVGSAKIYERDINSILEQNKDAGDKMQVLMSLINRQLLLANSDSYYMQVTKKQLQDEIASIKDFQESGVFSFNKFKKIITSNQVNVKDFEKNLSEQITIKQYLDLFKDSYFSSNAVKNKLAEIFSRERNISQYVIDPKIYMAQVKITDQEISQYYQRNKDALFTEPEKVKLSYLNLTEENVLNNISIDNKVIHNYIVSHESGLNDKYVDASHILFAVPQDSSTSYDKKQFEKAQLVLKILRENPDKFNELAQKYSDDTQSAKKYGELGSFKKGLMVKEFDAVVFNMKPNTISDIVKTQFGYHIIRLNNIKSSSNEEIMQKAIKALKKQQFALKWQQLQDSLNDLTYNNPKTLEVASKKLGLKIIDSDWLSKKDNSGLFSNKKIQDTVFSTDVLKNKNNSPIVDLGNNNIFVFRVIDYRPSFIESINQVKNQIIENIKKDRASILAYQVGESNILALKNGKLHLNFTNLQTVKLMKQNNDITPDMLKQIFSINLNKLPQYTGGINSEGKFVIYKIINEVIDKDLVKQNLMVVDNINKNQGMVEFGSYVSSLKNKFKVNYKTDFAKNQNN
jgi:peptidyl-prolyl cis-trans isomerase D